MTEYTVQLDQQFRGPADLLLQLVREDELKVQELSISKVCEGFLQFFRERSKSSIDDAAEFLVIAANLMWLKSNAILPHEQVDLEEELDPNDQLLGRLLEYRAFRDASQKLGAKAEERASRFERGGREETEEEPEVEMENLSSWDLMETFARLMKETLFDRPHAVKGEGKPLRVYAQQIYEKLKESKSTKFSELLAKVEDRYDIIGYFVAILELAKQGLVAVEQDGPVGDIALVIKEEGATNLDWNLFGNTTGEVAHG